jgi:RNA polymerase primary sigma factor
LAEADFDIKIEDDNYQLSGTSSQQNLRMIVLHEWQKKAIDFFWKSKGRALLEISTGGGKTFCAVQIIKQVLAEMPDAYILIVVPKNVILERTWYPELYAEGFTIASVGVYYGAAKEVRKITITNMQSIQNLDMALFDFIILDECHNFGTKRLLTILEHPFKYMLGLSATLDRIDKKHWKLMELFAYNKFEYTAKDALTDGILNKFDFFNVHVIMDEEDYEKYEKLTQDLNILIKQGGSFSKIMRQGEPELRNAVLAKINERKNLVLNYPSKLEALKNICKMHMEKKTVIFNEYNKTTTNCYFHLLDVGIKARIFHSGVEQKEREKILTDFKNDKFNFLLTTRVIDEGYNLRTIDLAIIMAGNSTARQTIQRLGRVLRKKEHKSLIYQIFIKDTMEERQAMERTESFRELASIYEDYKFLKEKGLIKL